MKCAVTLFLIASSLACLVAGQNASSSSSGSGSSSNGTSSSTSRPKTMAPSPVGSSGSNSGGLLGKIFNATFFSNHSHVNYTSAFLLCNADMAQITCSHPNQKAGILADTCDIALLNLLTYQEVVGVTALNQSYNNFTLQGCLLAYGQVCFAGCYANCTCTQPDGSPCGLCSQYNNATFPNSSSAAAGGGYGSSSSGGGSGTGTGGGAVGPGGSNTNGAKSPLTSAGSYVHAVLSMTTLTVGAILSCQVM